MMTSAAETREPLEESNPRGGDDIVMEDLHLEAPAGKQQQREEEDGRDDDDDEGPPPGWETLPPRKERGRVEGGDREDGDDDDDDDDGPPPGWSSLARDPIAPPADGSPSIAKLPPPPPPPVQNAGQMVCGSCRKLLSYMHGARYVKCPCCKTVNYVLEEHQVGHVQCSTCAVLLMYPFGAPAVKCSSCRSVTEIVENNRRPPWSVQQGHHLPPGTVS